MDGKLGSFVRPIEVYFTIPAHFIIRHFILPVKSDPPRFGLCVALIGASVRSTEVRHLFNFDRCSSADDVQ